MDKEKFQKEVISYYESCGRHNLPWRKHITPYRVLVSELMLQQTQVERVIPYFNRWMKQYPSMKKLSEASQGDVLRLWSGLGYNRRALALHKIARTLAHKKFPREKEELLKLPGIGHYTAGAILNFAFKQWTPFIDTNIRRVFLFRFFNDEKNVKDEEILEKMKEIGYTRSPREWGYALMDYGAFLKTKLERNPNKKSSHYRKQKPFLYSQRYWRSRILKMLLEKEQLKKEELISFITSERNAPKKSEIEKIISQMEKENFFHVEKGELIL